MRLAFRLLINLLSHIEAQLDQIENELRPHPQYRGEFQEAKKFLRRAVRDFRALSDKLGDNEVV
jgi:hypothetical protein